MALVEDPDFNIMPQSHGLFGIAKLIVLTSSYGTCVHVMFLTACGLWACYLSNKRVNID